jgi:hypothetical protein
LIFDEADKLTFVQAERGREMKSLCIARVNKMMSDEWTAVYDSELKLRPQTSEHDWVGIVGDHPAFVKLTVMDL